MASYFDKSNRLIIPRWRDFDSRILTVEHLPIQMGKFGELNLSGNDSIIRKIEDWQTEKTLGNAWELVNAAYVTDDFAIGKEAAYFLKQNIHQIPGHLKIIIFEVLGEMEPDEESKVNTISEVDDGIQSITFAVGKKIKHLKHKLSRNFRSEFLWIELARLYSVLGKNKKAENCVLVALQLSKGYNRFIIRAASRFYYHLGDFERAQKIVKSSPYFKKDPLLVAAEISYASRMGRSSRFVKLGFEQVESQRFSNSLVSDLYGMLGTLELKNNALKSARKLTNKSLLSPNDNSLAQAEWITHQLPSLTIDPDLISMDNAYEARAFEHLYAWKFKAALDEAIAWVIDQPFSKRAYHFVSYLCVCLTQDFDLAIESCKVGLMSNPEAFPLINNLIVAYSYTGKTKEAKKLLSRLAMAASDYKERIFWYATSGLVFYRSGDPGNGKQFYEEAIHQATKREDRQLKELAKAYFLREQFFAGELNYELVNKQLDDMIKGENNNFDIVTQVYAIKNSIEKQQSKK